MSVIDLQAHRIMLLDDDPFMLQVLTLQLAQLGFRQVIGCQNGAEALEQVSTSQASVDLILLDINMPGMDGVEFIRRLMECQFRGSVILVSGEDERLLESVQKLIEAHQLTALGHLQKPVKTEELVAVLSRFERHAAQDRPHQRRKRAYSAEQLREAITRGELVNHYQPKINLLTREVVGVECLVRWQHSTDGLIYPDQFIELAAEHGVLVELTRAVLTAALTQARAWRRMGQHIPVAVNVSMDDLSTLEFPDVAAALAGAMGIEPHQITLEVTEGQVMRKLSTVLDVLSRLRLKRFRLSVDDFGTGHSSLAQLRDLPFDELKVDRSFVHGACTEETKRAICSASLRMAHQLKLQVVAEGIEDREHWNLLREMGCDIGQGYFMARPMPARDFIAWIAQWRRGFSTGPTFGGLPGR